MKKWFYEIIYRIVPAEWIFGSTLKIEKLVELGIEGRIASGRVLTLGCGEGRESVYLAKQGFDVVGLDFSPMAIKKARHRAEIEGVEVSFIVDDLTHLQHVCGVYDLVTDFGPLNDMNQQDRDLYMENVLPFTKPGSIYLMFCFEKMLPSDEVQQRFSEYFSIEELKRTPARGFPGSFVFYAMVRNT